MNPTFNLEALFKPRSIAVVGASERPEAIGTRVIRNLRRLGYKGAIYPVNPRYKEIDKLPCYPSLAELPERPEAAFFGVPAPQTEALVKEAGRLGIRGVFMNANGFADGDADGRALQARVSAAARDLGVAICGPNNLGLINVYDKVGAWTPRYMNDPCEGPVALISQSGSIAIILADDERKVGFSHIITAGNEAVLTAADYLDYVVRDERTRVILLYLETIRDPEGFAAAAIEAQKRGKPVIALKLGSSEEGRALVQAHTGSLAGDDKLFSEFFRAHGIIRARDLDELVETSVLFASPPRVPPPTRGLAVVTLSGGEAALIADTASELGLSFPPLAAETLATLKPAFPPYATIRNPVDAWGLGFTPERIESVARALIADPAIGTIAMSVDAPGGGGADVPYAIVMANVCGALAPSTDKRFVFFNNLSGTGPNADVLAILKAQGIPYLSGMRPALAALGHSIRPVVVRTPGDVAKERELFAPKRLASSETGWFKRLAESGLPMAKTAVVTSAKEAASAAAGLGFPVVLKGAAKGIAHKSELGLVKVGLATAADVERAFAEVSAALSRAAPAGSEREIYLQEMAKPGVELIIGIRNMKGLGSFVVAGLGGIFVEMLKATSLRLGPVSEADALAMLEETPAARMLRGARGRPRADIAAAARAISALSRVGAATLGTIASLEINPLIVSEHGATGVDVVIEAETTN